MDTAEKIIEYANILAKSEFLNNIEYLNADQLQWALSRAVIAFIGNDWQKSENSANKTRQAYYFSAEYLVGRMIHNNLYALGILNKVNKILSEKGVNINCVENTEDAALGNGGLGRLAACLLDSAATQNINLYGYGIRYKYGLFKQKTVNGFQTELPDDWTASGDGWLIRKETEAVTVNFKKYSVKAVPYDMPVIPFGTNKIGTVRFWQSEPLEPFDFCEFNNQKYQKALEQKNNAENISRVLYPNDSGEAGKILRFMQQYFLCSASLKDILKKHKLNHGGFESLQNYVTVQLNDTHPIVSVPELIRLLCKQGMEFSDALKKAKQIFNFTNHTILPEALEKWSFNLIKSVKPEIAEIIEKINMFYVLEMKSKGVLKEQIDRNAVIINGEVHMANLACYCAHRVNGVAKIHTEIIKNDLFEFWHNLYPEKFVNITNGITQRRWLGVCNKNLADYITELQNSNGWITDLQKLKQLEPLAENGEVIKRFEKIRFCNKLALKNYTLIHDRVLLDENTIFDVQIKRLHEYKRQLLNVLAILELYFRIKEGGLKDFYPTTFIFAAKAAPGYFRAKGIIKLINEVGKLISADPAVSKVIKVVFLSNYNVSYAEKIIPAADISEQISTAGTEASGTGNMKLMLNGAVTLGTFDGANIEIVNAAGKQNNYIFGATVEQINKISKNYNPNDYYKNSKSVQRVLNSLINGTLNDGGMGCFEDIYNSLLIGSNGQKADNYYLLLDFEDYVNTKIAVNKDYFDKGEFFKKGWCNIANAGRFSSDRTVCEYAENIWQIKTQPKI